MWVTALPSFTVKHYEFTIYTVESSNAWISWKSFWTPQENGKRFSFSAAWWDVIMGWSWHATPRLYTLSYKIWNKENSAQQIVKHLALAPRTKILNPVCFFVLLDFLMLAAMQVLRRWCQPVTACNGPIGQLCNHFVYFLSWHIFIWNNTLWSLHFLPWHIMTVSCSYTKTAITISLRTIITQACATFCLQSLDTSGQYFHFLPRWCVEQTLAQCWVCILRNIYSGLSLKWPVVISVFMANCIFTNK